MKKGIYKAEVKGFTLVEILIVIAIVSILVTIAIPHLVRAKMNAQEVAAQATLKAIAAACENYSAANSGIYPTVMADLIGVTPPYLSKDYTAASYQGYDYDCVPLEESGYTCTAIPTTCGQTGPRDFVITTGSILTSVMCTP